MTSTDSYFASKESGSLAGSTRIVRRAREGSILLAMRGTARVLLEGSHGGEVLLQRERALWAPQGSSYRVIEEEDSVVLPLLQCAVAGSHLLAVPREILLAPGFDALDHFADCLGHFGDAPRPGSRLVEELLRAHEPVTSLLRLLDPPQPRSPAAMKAARRIIARPWKPNELAGFARLERISSRTLQRQFLDETGRCFSRWRADARLAAGLRLMLEERAPGGVAARVGFGSDSSLSRAMKQRLGVSPSEIIALAVERTVAGEMKGRAFELSAVPPERVRSNGTRRNGISGLGWLARGNATLTLEGATRAVGTGQELWLPAGVSHRIECSDDAVVLPYLWRGGAALPAQELRRLRESDEGSRLRVAADRYAWPRISGPLPATAWGLGSADSSDCEDPVGRAARTLRELATRNPGDERDLREWARALDVPVEALGPAFVRITGLPFLRWRATMRMVAGRRLLHSGMTVTAVANRLGYARVSSFSRAFAASHGVPPSRYRSRVLQEGS